MRSRLSSGKRPRQTRGKGGKGGPNARILGGVTAIDHVAPVSRDKMVRFGCTSTNLLSNTISVTRGSVLSTLLNSNASGTAAGIVTPVHTSVLIDKIIVTLPGLQAASNTAAFTINFTWDSDLGNDDPIQLMNPGVTALRLELRPPPKTRATMWSRAYKPQDAAASQAALNEVLFTMTASGGAESYIYFDVHMKATEALNSQAIITMTTLTATPLGNFLAPLDNLSNAGTKGTCVLVPIVPASQLITVPAAWVRSGG